MRKRFVRHFMRHFFSSSKWTEGTGITPRTDLTSSRGCGVQVATGFFFLREVQLVLIFTFMGTATSSLLLLFPSFVFFDLFDLREDLFLDFGIVTGVSLVS
jgi:hypothetical protein